METSLLGSALRPRQVKVERLGFYWLLFVFLLRKVLRAEERASVSLSSLSGLEGYHFPRALLEVWEL